MKNRLPPLCKLSVSAALLFLVMRKTDWAELAGLLSLSRGGLVLAAFGVCLLNLLLSNLRWYLLLRARPGSRAGFWALLDLSLVGIFFNTLVPGGVAGDLVRGHRARQYQPGGGEAFASVIVDRLLGFLGLVLLSAAGALFCWSTAGAFEWQKPLICIYITGIAGFFLFIAPPVSRRLHRQFAGSYALADRMLRLYSAVAAYPVRKEFWLALGASLLTSGLLVCTMRLLALAFGVPIPLAYLLWLVPTVGVILTLPVSLSGWGIREAGYVFFLQQVGIPAGQALMLSLSFGGLALLMGVLGGMWYLFSALSPGIRDILAQPQTELSRLPHTQA